MQAERRVASEYSISEQGNLLDYGFEPDGSSPGKTLPIFSSEAEQIRRSYTELRAKYPSGLALLCNEGQFLLEQGDLKSAAARFEAALKIESSFKQALIGYGLTLFEQKDIPSAQATFERVLQVDQDNLDAQINQAICLESIGLGEQAAAVWRKIIDRVEDEHIAQKIRQQIDN